MTLTRRFAISLAAALVVALPFAAGAAPPDHGAINRAVVAQHVTLGYERLADRAEALGNALQSYCQDPPADGLAAPRDAFHAAMDAWQRVQHLRHGAVEGNTRHPRVQFWPDKRGRVGGHLVQFLKREDAERFAPAEFAEESVAVQGFPALEILLFADDFSIPAEKAPASRETRCSAAETIAANIAAVAEETAEDWNGVAEETLDAKATTRDFYTDLVTGLAAIGSLKLLAPLGETPERARPRLAESWRSARSLANVAANLTGLEELYGAMEQTLRKGSEMSPRERLIRDQFEAARQEAARLEPSIAATLAADRGRVRIQSLIATVHQIRDLILQNLGGDLDMTLGFNALDGD